MSNRIYPNGSSNGHSQSLQPWGGLPDPMVANRLEALVNSTITSLRNRASTALDPRRDIDYECGYPTSSVFDDLDPEDYQRLYERHPIAAKVIEFWANKCWAVNPDVYEDPEAEEETYFECEWKALGAKLRGNDPANEGERSNWLKQEQGSPLWKSMKDLDIACGIGQYAVALFGIDDGKELNLPAERSAGPDVTRELMFVRVFPEHLCQVSQFETDKTNPRFGAPTEYLITFSDFKSRSAWGQGQQGVMRSVHWTRVLHLTDRGFASNPWFGKPRLRAVLNPIVDLRKVYGANGEGFWKAAFMGLSLETHPQMGGDVDVDRGALRDMLESYFQSLDRSLVLQGMSAKPLAPQVVDPTPHLDAHIQAICIQMDVAKRIFMGSERGELASSQDERECRRATRGIREGWLTSDLIGPFVSKLIWLGCLPEPEQIVVEWPDDGDLTEKEKAEVLNLRTTAYGLYVEKGIEATIPPLDYMTRFDDFEEDEACEILTSAAEHAAEADQENIAKAQEAIDKGLAPDPTKPQVVPGQPPGAAGKGFPPKAAGSAPGKPAGAKKPNPFAANVDAHTPEDSSST